METPNPEGVKCPREHARREPGGHSGTGCAAAILDDKGATV